MKECLLSILFNNFIKFFGHDQFFIRKLEKYTKSNNKNSEGSIVPQES